MDGLGGSTLPAPACYMIPTSWELLWKQQQQQRHFRFSICIRFKYTETEFVWESEKCYLSFLMTDGSRGFCKSSLILLSRWKPPSLLKWLTSSLQISNVVFSLSLPPFLTAIGLLSFSPSTNFFSQAGHSTSHIPGTHLQVRLCCMFWPLKSHSQAQPQHLPFHTVTHFLKIWETPSWPYMVDHVKNGNSAHNIEGGLIICSWLISWKCNANSITSFLAFIQLSTANLLLFWFFNYCVLSSCIISPLDFFLLLNFY